MWLQFLMFWVLQSTLYDWKSSDSLVLIGPSWSDFSLALVLFGLYECVCNNSLKPYHGEIIRPCYSDGHYRSTTCITSSLLISQNGYWRAAPRELLCELHVCMSVHVFKSVCLCMWGKSHLYMCVWVVFVSRCLVRGVWGCVCMHGEWHLAKCGSERRNIWLIIEVPWKKYDHESVLGLRAQL